MPNRPLEAFGTGRTLQKFIELSGTFWNYGYKATGSLEASSRDQASTERELVKVEGGRVLLAWMEVLLCRVCGEYVEDSLEFKRC